MSNNNGQKLAGKVAVVTGGSRGIGAAIAKRLATDGARMATAYTKGAAQGFNPELNGAKLRNLNGFCPEGTD